MSEQPAQLFDSSQDPMAVLLGELRAEVQLLRAICRAAGALLSGDDSLQAKERWRAERMERYTQAQADYFRRFGRSPW